MSHPNILEVALEGIERLDYAAFRDLLALRLEGDARLLTLFGIPNPGNREAGPDLHAVFLDPKEGLIHLAGRQENGGEYLPLSVEFPQVHCFEREIHEQFGLPMPGHPWLKPIRFEGATLGRMDQYPFYNLAGKEVHEVGVGPVHAGVIEPGHFRFMCHGETVHHLEIQLGYQHRGVEQLLRSARPQRQAPLVESIAGDTAVGHVVAFCRAWEALCGAEPNPGVELVRGVALELERVAMHLAGLAGLATDVAFLPGGSTYGRLRTTVINLSMRLCGSRFGRGWFRPGQLRFPFGKAQRDDIAESVLAVRRDIALINDLFLKSRSVRHRLATTGAVPAALAAEIGLVGLSARASGLPRDLRVELRGGAYRECPMPIVVEPAGDCQARAVARIREIDHSLEWLARVAEGIPDLEADPAFRAEPLPNRLAISFEESWRGEVMHAVETDSAGRVSHHKVQDPSLRNWFGLAQAVRNNDIYDFPICNKSFDLSYCGNDL